jgi:hypothetical protein
MVEIGTAKLGFWAWLALFTAASTVLVSNANRFLPPSGEKFTTVFGQGAADLIPSFNAASALLAGQNPYHYDLKRFPDPFAESRGKAQHITYLYMPTHVLLYVPIVWLTGGDFERAARLQFLISLIVLVLLAVAVIDMLGAIIPMELDLRCALLVVIVFVLGLNAGNQLGLERGQSDLITAALCWWAAVAFRRGWWLAAAFLAVASVLLKGYGLLLAGGLLLLGLNRTAWRRTVAGAALAVLVLLAPVARYLPDAASAYNLRAQLYWGGWHNQSVYNLFYMFNPAIANTARAVCTAIACTITLLAWLALRTATRSQRGGAAELALHLTLFSTAALISVVSFSRNSLAYDAVLPLPGALLIALTQSQLYPRLPPRFSPLIGSWLALMMFGLCAFSVSVLVGWAHRDGLPVHGAALQGMLLLIALISVRGLSPHPQP